MKLPTGKGEGRIALVLASTAGSEDKIRSEGDD